MENNFNGMVGMGRMQNGVMTFVDATGKGFAKKLSTPVIHREPAIKNEVSMIEDVQIDVPSFMKNRVRHTPVVESNVVHFPTSYKGETKRTFRSDIKKVWNWLWTEGGEK